MSELITVRVRAKVRPTSQSLVVFDGESEAFPSQTSDAHTASSTSKTHRVFGGASIADVATSAAHRLHLARSGDPNPIAGGTNELA